MLVRVHATNVHLIAGPTLQYFIAHVSFYEIGAYTERTVLLKYLKI